MSTVSQLLPSGTYALPPPSCYARNRIWLAGHILAHLRDCTLKRNVIGDNEVVMLRTPPEEQEPDLVLGQPVEATSTLLEVLERRVARRNVDARIFGHARADFGGQDLYFAVSSLQLPCLTHTQCNLARRSSICHSSLRPSASALPFRKLFFEIETGRPMKHTLRTK